MAAYLVGTQGRPLHAVGLGLSVALSHTLGILALAGLIVGAQGVLPPEVVLRTTPVVAAVSVVAIGGWMLVGEARRRRSRRAAALDHDRAHASGAAHEHPHDHDHDHEPHRHAPRRPASTVTAACATATFPRPARRSRGAACSSSGWPAG